MPLQTGNLALAEARRNGHKAVAKLLARYRWSDEEETECSTETSEGGEEESEGRA